jgi:hypothetical protein
MPEIRLRAGKLSNPHSLGQAGANEIAFAFPEVNPAMIVDKRGKFTELLFAEIRFDID